MQMKHQGSVRRVTTASGKILKRPVVLMKFYMCKICGKELALQGKETIELARIRAT